MGNHLIFFVEIIKQYLISDHGSRIRRLNPMRC